MPPAMTVMHRSKRLHAPRRKHGASSTTCLFLTAALLLASQHNFPSDRGELFMRGEGRQPLSSVSRHQPGGKRERVSRGSQRKEKGVTPEIQNKVDKAAQEATMLHGKVKRVNHPFADIALTLKDGTQVDGQLHVKDLGEGYVDDITDCLSVDETVRARIIGVQPMTGRIRLSLCPHLTTGLKVSGSVARILPNASGATINLDVGKVFLPKREASFFKDLKVGSAIAPLWVLTAGNDSRNRLPVVTANERKVMRADKRKTIFELFVKAMESGEFLDGVVTRLWHPSADIQVTLADGIHGTGRLRAMHLGKSQVEDISRHLSLGKRVRVRVLAVPSDMGFAELSLCPAFVVGQELSGKVIEAVASGFVVRVGKGKEQVFLPAYEASSAKRVKVGRKVARMWIMRPEVDGGLAIATMRQRVMSPSTRKQLAVAMEAAELLIGKVLWLRHPFAHIQVTLADGSVILGDLHVSKLGKNGAEDIADHMSIGDTVRVRVFDLPTPGSTGHPSLSMCPALTIGQEVTGTALKIDNAGMLVGIGDGQEDVFVPHPELANLSSLQVGSTVAPMWILSSGERFTTVGTMREGRVVTLETRKRLVAAIEMAEFLDGVVENVRHPFADIMVRLDDDTAALGSVHVRQLGKGHVEDIAQHLSVGEKVLVRPLEVPAGHPVELSMCPALAVGQEVSGTVEKIEGAGFLLTLSDCLGQAFLPNSESSDLEGLQIGSTVEPIWIKSIGDSGSHPVATALRGRAMTSEMHEKFSAAMENAENLDGVVKKLKHPYANIMITLADGSAALGGLHVRNLRKWEVEDIEQHLSVGEKVCVRIQNLPDAKHHYLGLALAPHYIAGEQVNGTVVEMEASGFHVKTDDGHEVFLPGIEVPNSDSLSIGDTVAIWILSPGDAFCNPLGTMKPEGAMTLQKEEEIAAVIKNEWTLDGVVRRIKHTFADVTVSLPDGTETEGQLCGKSFNKNDQLSVGDQVQVRIIGTPAETGQLTLALHSQS